MKNDPDINDLVQSSVREIERAEKSIFWIDIKAILEDWNTGLKSDYDNARNMEEVKYLQGISECIKYVLNLPEAMKLITSDDYEGNDNES